MVIAKIEKSILAILAVPAIVHRSGMKGELANRSNKLEEN
jgi:hypothetical protein